MQMVKQDALPPFMGFFDERHVPARNEPIRPYQIGTAAFYTCVVNGKRVFLWDWGKTTDGPCCVIGKQPPVIDMTTEELRFLFREEIQRDGRTTIRLGVNDPFMLQSILIHITSGGNDEQS